MSIFRKTALLVVAGAAFAATAAERYPGIGRAATPKEVAAWDIDVRPDFKGLPAGRGSVAQGQQVWEAKCASCHGVFGESNEVFNPIVGGTTAADVKAGRTAALKDPAYPGRTTLMKLPTVSSLWDYVNRAMPWNAPKSLATDEVYAVTAYMLNLGGIVADDFVLDARSIADVQQRLPNRDGMSTRHAMWPGKGLPGTTARPDVQGSACMANCGPEPKIVSSLPDHARNAHGNLADQNRRVGAQRGMVTAAAAVAAAATPAAAKGGAAIAPTAMLSQNACVACHAMDGKLVGPSFKEVASRYAARPDAAAHLAARIKQGSTGVWGAIPMPPQALPEADAALIARWLAEGAQP